MRGDRTGAVRTTPPRAPAGRWPIRVALLLCSLPTLPQALAQGEVFKCVDRGGHVTYQQAPCTGGAKGGQVELVDPVVPGKRAGPAAPATPVDQGWPAMAREKRIAVGMPKTFVTEAMGAPIEIRTPRTGETGGEVWVYSRAGQVTRIGFQNNLVAWMRSDTTLSDSKPGSAGAVTPAPAPSREVRVREALVVGKTCNAALAEAGPADREEALAGPGGGGTRYIFAFDTANANAYAAAVCIGGRITSVERYVPNSN